MTTMTQEKLDAIITAYFGTQIEEYLMTTSGKIPSNVSQEVATQMLSHIQSDCRLQKMDARAKILADILAIDKSVLVISAETPSDSYFGFYIERSDVDVFMRELSVKCANPTTLTGPINNMTDQMIDNFINNENLIIITKNRCIESEEN